MVFGLSPVQTLQLDKRPSAPPPPRLRGVIFVVCLSRQTRRNTPQLMSGYIAHEEWRRMPCMALNQAARGMPWDIALYEPGGG